MRCLPHFLQHARHPQTPTPGAAGKPSTHKQQGLLVLGAKNARETASEANKGQQGPRKKQRPFFNFYEDGRGQWVRLMDMQT
jgi:hypothetical protein